MTKCWQPKPLLMHELAICQALLDKVEEIARQRSAVRVTQVRVAIGPLSGVEPHLLVQAYALASAGTVADGARLAIVETPLRVRCRSCDAETAASVNRLVCGVCGDWHTDVISGDDMVLLQLELDAGAAMIEAQNV